jgi:hypothetical protein
MIMCFGDWGYGLTFSYIQSIIAEYLLQTEQQYSFKNGKPGKDWWYGFKNRWKTQLPLKLAENIASTRAASCTEEIINRYFINCQSKFNEEGIDLNKGSFVWNCDETGFSGDQGRIEILCRRGSKRPMRLTGNNEKIHYTVHNCCNASGYFMPPFIVYKSEGRLYDKWMKGGPKNAVYTTSSSGWMEKQQFFQWLERVFVPEIQKLPGNKHILLLDGHGSHITLQAVEICLLRNIVLICLPAHSSHMQPLDVGVYCHVKKVWRKILSTYYESSGYRNLDKENFAPQLK